MLLLCDVMKRILIDIMCIALPKTVFLFVFLSTLHLKLVGNVDNDATNHTNIISFSNMYKVIEGTREALNGYQQGGKYFITGKFS